MCITYTFQDDNRTLNNLLLIDYYANVTYKINSKQRKAEFKMQH